MKTISFASPYESGTMLACSQRRQKKIVFADDEDFSMGISRAAPLSERSTCMSDELNDPLDSAPTSLQPPASVLKKQPRYSPPSPTAKDSGRRTSLTIQERLDLFQNRSSFRNPNDLLQSVSSIKPHHGPDKMHGIHLHIPKIHAKIHAAARSGKKLEEVNRITPSDWIMRQQLEKEDEEASSLRSIERNRKGRRNKLVSFDTIQFRIFDTNSKPHQGDPSIDDISYSYLEGLIGDLSSLYLGPLDEDPIDLEEYEKTRLPRQRLADKKQSKAYTIYCVEARRIAEELNKNGVAARTA